jgi:3-dehydroquinate dehydratase / shikimate dehydrogenase
VSTAASTRLIVSIIAADPPLLVTVRGVGEGGAWEADDATRVALIERLGLLLPGWIDVEGELWGRSANLRQKIGLVAETGPAGGGQRAKNKLMASTHITTGTPADLDGQLAALRRVPAAAHKLVCTADDAEDALRILDLLAAGDASTTVAMGMGTASVATRVLAAKLGAFGVFAALDEASPAAPGQIGAEQLVEQYRFRAVKRDTAVYGVVGWPVAHSHSPRVHNAAMASAGVNGVYVPWPVRPTRDDFFRFMQRAAASAWLDLRGLSVTIPHKEHALAWLDENGWPVSATARRCGAVNTLTRRGDAWSGDNTDVAGIDAAIELAATRLGHSPRKALVLGAGGAARAAVVALAQRGIAVCIANRTHSRAAALAEALAARAVEWGDRHTTAAACDLVVQCTSVGLAPHSDESPLDPGKLPRAAAIVETIYNPARTRLLAAAEACGLATVPGDVMFRAQAAAQFRLWHTESQSS